jgi:hypothetical protein
MSLRSRVWCAKSEARAEFSPEVIEIMTAALEAAIATLPEAVQHGT